jgi:hypothetical protein
MNKAANDAWNRYPRLTRNATRRAIFEALRDQEGTGRYL